MAIERPEETLTRLWDAKHPLVNQLEKLIQLERSEQPSKYGFVEQAAGKSLSKSFARSGILSGGESHVRADGLVVVKGLIDSREFQKALARAYDQMCGRERELCAGSLSEVLAAVAQGTYVPPLPENVRMSWALQRHPDPIFHCLGDIIFFHDKPQYPWREFIQHLAQLAPDAEARMQRKFEKRLAGYEQDLQHERALRKLAESRSAVPVTNGKSAPRRPETHVREQIDKKNLELRNLHTRIGELEEELRQKEAKEPSEPAAPCQVLSLTDYRRSIEVYRSYDTLMTFYRDRTVIAVGGFRGQSPMGTTRSYHQFLRDLGTRLMTFSADERTQTVGDKLKQCQFTDVIIYFSYCAGHNLHNAIKKHATGPIVQVSKPIYDEQQFIRDLLKAVPKP